MITGKTKTIFWLTFVLFIIFCVFYLQFVWNKSLVQKSNQSMTFAKVAEISLNGEMLKQLRATSTDIGTVAYESLKGRLINLLAVDPEIRFTYIYTQNNDKLYFMVDSEPEGSKDIALPGMEYIISSAEYSKPFTDGKSLVTKPATDQWGTWVSVLVPMKESSTGKVIAVFAMDYPASQWNDEALFQTVQAGFIIFIIYLLFLAFIILVKSNLKLKESEQQVRERTKSLEQSEADLIRTLSDSEKINKLMVGRELEMINLKKQIIDLKNSIK